LECFEEELLKKIGRLFTLWVILVLVGCAGPTVQQQTDAETHYMLGVSYLRERDATRALKEFLIAEKADPENKNVHAALGQAYQLKKAYALAEQHYLKAIALNPDEPQIKNNLGALYLDLKQWDRAIEQFRQAAGNLLFSEAEVSLTGMGFAYFNKAQYLDAVEAYRKALQANPQYAQAHFYLGEAYSALNKPELAIKSYLEAIKLSPNYVLAHYRLGLAYMRIKELVKAKSSFSRVIELAPDSEPGLQAKDYLAIIE
jgi:Tfp pilus assembly protein PilF